MTDENTSLHTPALGDPARIDEIAELSLLSPEADDILQATVEEAAERLNLPTALVTVITEQAQYYAAFHGIDGWLAQARGTPVEWAFCVNAVQTGEPFVVEDATRHPLVRDNPLVTVDGIRCYAGIPLVTSRGHTLGTLCVAGKEARTFSPEEMAELRALADRAVARIEERRKGDESAGRPNLIP